jgi:hypothetical protein
MNFSSLENGQPLNLDNISFKGAEIADLMGLEFEQADDHDHHGN